MCVSVFYFICFSFKKLCLHKYNALLLILTYTSTFVLQVRHSKHFDVNAETYFQIRLQQLIHNYLYATQIECTPYMYVAPFTMFDSITILQRKQSISKF